MGESKSPALPLGYIPPARQGNRRPGDRRSGTIVSRSQPGNGTRQSAPPPFNSLRARAGLALKDGSLLHEEPQKFAPRRRLRYGTGLAITRPLSALDLAPGKPKFRLTVGRSVAQPGSALASGARGRRFESSRSDQSFQWLIKFPDQRFPRKLREPYVARGRAYWRAEANTPDCSTPIHSRGRIMQRPNTCRP
jgi:hypothetical protein